MKRFGIAAIVIAIISIFISEIVWVYLMLMAAVLAACSVGEGFVLGVTALATNSVNILFMILMLCISGTAQKGIADAPCTAAIGAILLLSQSIAYVILLKENKKLQSIHTDGSVPYTILE